MSENLQTVTVIGLGHIGLSTAALLASKGFQVHGCDVNPKIIEGIKQGKPHIVEKDLDEILQKITKEGRLTASFSPAPADIFIIAVPTPFKDNYKPDLSYIEAAIKAVAPHVKPNNLIVLESTSPVGTTEKIVEWLTKLRPDLKMPSKGTSHPDQVSVAYCSERVLPGQILYELTENNRVLGGIDQESGLKANHFYQKFVNGKIHLTNARTAEMIKLAENSFRDTNIAFANELSLVCEKLDMNVWEVIRLANDHPRVNILKPGPGVGGHCIAVDPWFIIDAAPDEAKLMRTAREVNDSKPPHVLKLIKSHIKQIKNPVIACLGLTFKADVNDLRESPALQIVESLAKEKIGDLLLVEPYIEALPSSLQSFGKSVQLVNLTEALKAAHLVVLLVDHKIFYQVDPSLLKEKRVVDTRGIWA